MQLGEGQGRVEPDYVTCQYTKVVRQPAALSGEAVGLFGDVQGVGRCGHAGEFGVKGGKEAGGGVGHGFSPRQQVVDNQNIAAYNAISSGADSPFVSALSVPRSDSAGWLLSFPAFPFVPSFAA